MNGKINKNKNSGYSLIEALVALGILLLGIIPVVTLATQAILFHHRAAEAEEAARISQTMIDYIKSRGYDNLGPFTTTSPYTLTSTSGGAFTVNDFASDFAIDPQMVLINSKGLNLNIVSFYVNMKKVKGDLKKSDKSSDTYTDPVTGESGQTNVYKEDLVYGEFIFGMGKTTTDVTKKTGREKELKTTFIITPIENWK
jgi:type II secretory pathway pseudopilin PulG